MWTWFLVNILYVSRDILINITAKSLILYSSLLENCLLNCWLLKFDMLVVLLKNTKMCSIYIFLYTYRSTSSYVVTTTDWMSSSSSSWVRRSKRTAVLRSCLPASSSHIVLWYTHRQVGYTYCVCLSPRRLSAAPRNL